jgi:hypothetical protein
MVACKEVAASDELWQTIEDAGGRPRHLDVVEDENWVSGRSAKDAATVAEHLAAMVARTPEPACEVPRSGE